MGGVELPAVCSPADIHGYLMAGDSARKDEVLSGDVELPAVRLSLIHI